MIGVPRVACGVDVRTQLARRCEGTFRTDYKRGVVDMDEIQMNDRERGGVRMAREGLLRPGDAYRRGVRRSDGKGANPFESLQTSNRIQ